ncbi:DUF3899 domain-containing protein [Vallitalea guaymasensis]|uniref:DUF3899 domain-containing protein n=1 Tax=Vallitalea guaymasensis TaxID=1185412 RepID=A0A8J8M949_9FIRM|nr:DUF3899 domain-containing protein [Vallitalea guaymasensis]QUH28608.1 DUF3899 domain-containing protein [Vallitalea guaymasensis]
MKKNVKKIIIYILIAIIASLLLAVFDKRLTTHSITLFHIFLEKLFLVNLLIFIITGIVFIDDQGTFNVFKYSTKHYRASVSKKYKYRLQQEYALKSKQEIKEFLKEKYLYAPKKHSSTTTFFYCSIIMLIIYILFIGL